MIGADVKSRVRGSVILMLLRVEYNVAPISVCVCVCVCVCESHLHWLLQDSSTTYLRSLRNGRWDVVLALLPMRVTSLTHVSSPMCPYLNTLLMIRNIVYVFRFITASTRCFLFLTFTPLFELWTPSLSSFSVSCEWHREWLLHQVLTGALSFEIFSI